MFTYHRYKSIADKAKQQSRYYSAYSHTSVAGKANEQHKQYTACRYNYFPLHTVKYTPD